MYNQNDTKQKEKACWLYIDNEPLVSYRDVQNKMTSKDINEKAEALRSILGSITNDDNYPDNLMISVIHHLTIVDDVRLKKLLFLFWEVIEKQHVNTGKIREEFLLVCNSLRKDLTHPNEYVRGRTLRLLTKLPYVEILESLKTVVFDNLNHNHFYVRNNALMCLISFVNNFGIDVLPDNIGERLKELILKDNDIATKRNAYLVLSKVDPKESYLITKELLQTNEVNDIGDLFALTIVENLKNLCTLIPKDKSKLIKLILDLSNHKSHSVLFEIGITLIQLSSNPNNIRNAVNILCNLLVEQKDNNTLIIILKKLMEIKNKYRDILEEQILSFAIILDANCSSELRKLLFELISDLIKESNITSVFEILVNDFNKIKNINDNPSTIEFKNMILMSLYKNIKKFPNVNKSYPIFLLERCLMYDSKNTFLDDQLSIFKDLFFMYSKTLGNEFINKIFHHFGDINSAEIVQTCVWMISEYADNLETLKKMFDLIMKNIGDLNFELLETNGLETQIKDVKTEKKTITKTVVLPDGTYGTQTIVVDPSEFNKQKDTKFLRNFILETSFFFSTNIAVSLTRIVIQMFYLDQSENKDIFKAYYFNTINIICAILKMNSHKIYKDPDNISRVTMCLDFLLNSDFERFMKWVEESKELYYTFYANQNSKTSSHVASHLGKRANVDDYISFRHVKPFDPDNMDIVEDEVQEIPLEKKKMDDLTSNNNQHKFTEVLTGSEDPLHIEAVVEIFTFDIVMEFFIKNKTKTDFQNIALDLFAPTNLDIIEKSPPITLAGGESKTVRSCIKFSSTCNSYIFGQVSYANSKGVVNILNLSGIFIDLLVIFILLIHYYYY